MTRKRPAKKAAARAAKERDSTNEEGYLHDHEHPEFQERFANMLSCLNVSATNILKFPEAEGGPPYVAYEARTKPRHAGRTVSYGVVRCRTVSYGVVRCRVRFRVVRRVFSVILNQS